MVSRPQDVERYAACTFFASVPSQESANDSDAIIKTTVQFLVQNEFVGFKYFVFGLGYCI